MFKPGIYALHCNGAIMRWEFSELETVKKDPVIMDYWVVASKSDLEKAKTDAKQIDNGFPKIFS